MKSFCQRLFPVSCKGRGQRDENANRENKILRGKMKRIHFDVEEDGFFGAYWVCKDTHTVAGTDSIETVPAI